MNFWEASRAFFAAMFKLAFAPNRSAPSKLLGYLHLKMSRNLMAFPISPSILLTFCPRSAASSASGRTQASIDVENSLRQISLIYETLREVYRSGFLCEILAGSTNKEMGLILDGNHQTLSAPWKKWLKFDIWGLRTKTWDPLNEVGFVDCHWLENSSCH